jgi:hypothetical protein
MMYHNASDARNDNATDALSGNATDDVFDNATDCLCRKGQSVYFRDICYLCL